MAGLTYQTTENSFKKVNFLKKKIIYFCLHFAVISLIYGIETISYKVGIRYILLNCAHKKRAVKTKVA